MNFYVYTESEIKSTLDHTCKYLQQMGVDYLMESGCSDVPDYKSYNLSLKSFDGFSITYPAGSLWNRKIQELLFKEYFPPINPIEAHYFLVPVAVLYGNPFSLKSSKKKFNDLVVSTFCRHLPHWNYHKNSHVFFVIGDSHDEIEALKEGNVFRPSCYKDGKDHVIYYDVLIDTSYVQNIKNCTKSCAFVGCLETHPLRRDLPFAIEKIAGDKIFESTPNFFSLLPGDVQNNMHNRWIEALNDSEFILAPRGCGLTSIRFFEALSFGRIPVLIADETKLPLKGIIEYEKFIVRVPESKIMDISSFISKFRDTHDLVLASETAKNTWLKYFSGGKLRRYLESSLPAINEVKRYKII